MQLFLIRHGLAESVSHDGTDAGRSLTEQGVERFREVTRALGKLGVEFDLVLHSPLRRCVQTASLLESVTKGPIREDVGLAQAPAEPLLEAARGERVALVGHEPWMSEMVGWLCGARGHFALRMGKGTVAWLEGDPRPSRMRLVGLMTARMARDLISRP